MVEFFLIFFMSLEKNIFYHIFIIDLDDWVSVDVTYSIA